MKSIQGHLTGLLATGFGTLLVVSGLAIYFLTRAALLAEFDSGLRARAFAIMTQSEQNASGLQVELSPAIKHDFNDAGATQFFEIWRTNGSPVTRSESLGQTDLPMNSGPQDRPFFWNVELPGDRDGRAIGIRFMPKSEDEDRTGFTPAEAVLAVAEDSGVLDRSLATLAGVLVGAGALSLALMVPVVRFSVRRGHAPLAALTRQVAGINADSLAVRFPLDNMPEELRPVAGRLNDVLQRLEASFERERRFSADLAHELRTPLAELRTLAEVGLQFAERPSPETHRETLAIALQMQAIVTRLLDLARCENGRLQIDLEPVPLAALVQEVWRPLVASAETKKLRARVEISPGAVLKSDPALLRSILANLLSNAVNYSPAGREIAIAWNEKTGEFSVNNTVEDLTPDDLPHLFERLWRKDKARTESEHNGLGLALSRAFAEVLGFQLTARFTGEKTLSLLLTTRHGAGGGER